MRIHEIFDFYCYISICIFVRRNRAIPAKQMHRVRSLVGRTNENEIFTNRSSKSKEGLVRVYFQRLNIRSQEVCPVARTRKGDEREKLALR